MNHKTCNSLYFCIYSSLNFKRQDHHHVSWVCFSLFSAVTQSLKRLMWDILWYIEGMVDKTSLTKEVYLLKDKYITKWRDRRIVTIHIDENFDAAFDTHVTGCSSSRIWKCTCFNILPVLVELKLSFLIYELFTPKFEDLYFTICLQFDLGKRLWNIMTKDKAKVCCDSTYPISSKSACYKKLVSFSLFNSK